MFCTCKNLDCPLHPSNHDKGCSPCISKILKLREMPECFFQKLEHAEDRGGKRVRQVRRDQRHDFYDVWIFHADVLLEELTLQATEVTQAMWADREQLEELYRRGELHPLIDYIDILE